MPSREPNGRETMIAAILAIIFGIGSFFFSFAAIVDYLSVPLVALALAAVHYLAVYYVFIRSSTRVRWALLLISVPLALVSIDNLGRFSAEMGGPAFRIFG